MNLFDQLVIINCDPNMEGSFWEGIGVLIIILYCLDECYWFEYWIDLIDIFL